MWVDEVVTRHACRNRPILITRCNYFNETKSTVGPFSNNQQFARVEAEFALNSSSVVDNIWDLPAAVMLPSLNETVGFVSPGGIRRPTHSSRHTSFFLSQLLAPLALILSCRAACSLSILSSSRSRCRRSSSCACCWIIRSVLGSGVNSVCTAPAEAPVAMHLLLAWARRLVRWRGVLDGAATGWWLLATVHLDWFALDGVGTRELAVLLVQRRLDALIVGFRRPARGALVVVLTQLGLRAAVATPIHHCHRRRCYLGADGGKRGGAWELVLSALGRHLRLGRLGHSRLRRRGATRILPLSHTIIPLLPLPPREVEGTNSSRDENTEGHADSDSDLSPGRESAWCRRLSRSSLFYLYCS